MWKQKNNSKMWEWKIIKPEKKKLAKMKKGNPRNEQGRRRKSKRRRERIRERERKRKRERREERNQI